jgi:hypothetical protein
VRKAAWKAEGEGFEPSIRLTTDNGFRDRRIFRMAVIGTPLEHIAGALWTSVDLYGLSGLQRLSHLQGDRVICKSDALNS